VHPILLYTITEGDLSATLKKVAGITILPRIYIVSKGVLTEPIYKYHLIELNFPAGLRSKNWPNLSNENISVN